MAEAAYAELHKTPDQVLNDEDMQIHGSRPMSRGNIKLANSW
jgi:hypothetical protein